jgi:3-hydroxyisobutyrate dehydrogenase-like beta-hydroxyacid dehydrogenase
VTGTRDGAAEQEPLLFVGVGKMGRLIVARLLAAGHAVHVFDESAEALALVDGGALAVAREAASPVSYRTVVLCLPESGAVETLSERWLSDLTQRPAQTGTVIADLTSVPAATARSLASHFAAHGVAYLDSPVSGGERGAASGELVVMTSGDQVAFERVAPLLRQIGNRLHHVGESGRGSQMKAVNQHVYLAYNFAFAQGLRLGRDLGLPEQAVMDMLSHGAPGHTLINDRLPVIRESHYTRGFPIWRCLKDLDYLETPPGFESMALAAFAPLYDALRAAVEGGDGGLDILALGNPPQRPEGESA